MRFDLEAIRKEVRSMQGEEAKVPSICGVSFPGKVRIYLKSGEYFEGTISKISKFEIAINQGSKKVVIFKSAISHMIPL